MTAMTPIKPFLVRALYEWITQNGLTPYIVVSTTHSGVRVPPGLVEENRIILDISAIAVKGLVMGDEFLEFDARFGIRIEHVVIPQIAILAVYAKENGRGMEFPEEESTGTGTGSAAPPASESGSTEKSSTSQKPSLTLVKK